MTDRYDDGLRALDTLEPPDQWDEIQRRAAGGLIVPLDADRPQRRGRWPLLLAAAALVLVIAGAAATLRDEPVTTIGPRGPGMGPDSDHPAPSTTAPAGPRSTAADPSTSSTTAPSDEPGGTGAPSRAEPVPTSQTCPQDLSLATSHAPPGWATRMTPAADWLPDPPPDNVRPDLAGVFDGPATDQYVFVLAGLPGEQDDAFQRFPAPVPGNNLAIAPYPGGWYVETPIPRPDGACWITLQVAGMSQDEAVRFTTGLQGR